MSGQEETDLDRDLPPTERRLQQAREKGDLPRSADLAGAVALGGFVLAAALFGPQALGAAGQAGAGFLSRVASGQPLAEAMAMIPPLWPFAALPAAAVLCWLLAARELTFTGEKLMPQLSRINPLAVAKQRFGADGLGDFVKALAKVVLTGLLLWWFARTRMDETFAAAAVDPRLAAAGMVRVAVDFLLAVTVLAVLLGVLDRLWQQHRWLVRNRMSRKELLDETKEGEGDPYLRMERRRRGQELAMNQMLADVPKADVVIVNPTHYAVALKWDRRSRKAPVCVAKGTDEVALRIRASAAEAGVPIHRDPPTARAIHAAVRIGEPIRPEHYRAVAAAIRFAEAMRRRARSSVTGSGGRP
ncbi:MAG: hypothetical protein RIR62_3075 [Pseudomonadota bacterium]|jgi:flagellar biosynthetic protein FlhB